MVQRDHRWHEHDPNEIIQACQDCIDEAVRNIEAAGYPKTSIKVIGTSVVYSSGAGQKGKQLQGSRTNAKPPSHGAVGPGSHWPRLSCGQIHERSTPLLTSSTHWTRMVLYSSPGVS